MTVNMTVPSRTNMTARDLIETANALTNLVHLALSTTARARRSRQIPLMNQARSIGLTLDATRLQLISNGPRYLTAARAFTNEATRMLDEISHDLDQAAIESTNPHDVEAMLRQYGVELTLWQRRLLHANAS